MKKQVFIMLSLVAALGTAVVFPDTVGADEVIMESTEDEKNTAGKNIDSETGLVIPELKDWDYTKDDANKILLIKDYRGFDSYIKVPAAYMIDGTKYKVKFTLKRKDYLNEEGVFSKHNLVKEVFLEDGITGDFRYLFKDCCNLKKANIPSGVTDCTSMFEKCTSLVETPTIPAGVTECKSMFAYCENLEEPPEIPSGVVNCNLMFYHCEKMAKAPEIPSGVERCQMMFAYCKSIVEAPDIPLRVTDANRMFSDCSELVKAPNLPESIEDASAMFEDCSKLSGSMEISGRIQKLYHWYYAGKEYNVGMFENAATEGDGLTIYYADDVNIDEILETKSANSKITAKPLSEKPGPKPDTPKPDTPKPSDPTPDTPKPSDPTPATPSGTKVATYGNDTFYQGDDGNLRCYENGKLVTNEFKFDGTYTYYMQADGTPMKDRLTYHPDGEHIIYLDTEGHEVFANFQYCPSVDYICYFDSQGYLYKDQITFVGDKTYYLNANGALEQNGWFQFANGLDYGWANGDGTLITTGFSADPYGRTVFYHWNGMVARGLITDGAYYYNMDTTDGHYLGQFPVQ